MQNLNLIPVDGITPVTREFWLLQAAKRIPSIFFDDELQLPDDLQVSVGWVRGNQEKVLGVCSLPKEDDILTPASPATIVLNHNVEDTEMLIEILVHECIHAFGIKGHGKAFGKFAEIAGFEKPFKFHNPTDLLKTRVHDLHMQLVSEFGPYPGQAVFGTTKVKKEREKKIIDVSCPMCEYKVKVNRKLVEAYGSCKCPVHNVDMVEDDAPAGENNDD